MLAAGHQQICIGRRRPNGTVIQLVYKLFSQEGKKFGYLINGSKSWLIVKPG